MHATIVDDHVAMFNFGIIFGNFSRRLQEQTVRKLHNISFVNCGDLKIKIVNKLNINKLKINHHLLPSVFFGEFETVTSDSLGIGSGDDFHRLHDSADALVFEHSVFSFGVLSENRRVFKNIQIKKVKTICIETLLS